MTADARRILLGHIAGAHGIRGDVVVKSYTEEPEDIAAYGPLQSEDGRRSFELTVVNVMAKGVIVRVKGVGDRNGAEALKGTALYVDRAKLPEADDGAYYHADLIGLAAHDADGTPVGRIVAVHNFGAGDLLELAPAKGGKTELIPFTDACVPSVDIAGRRVVVVMPIAADDDGEPRKPDAD